MTTKAIIFDMDGTLVDTNGTHALAWQQSFRDQGFDISLNRIYEEIGKGGDLLVESIVGKEADRKYGEKLRHGHTEHFLDVIKSNPIQVFRGAKALIKEVRELGLKSALASSSKLEELEAIEKSSGVAWRELFDAVVSSSDVESSKPSPDSITVAVEKMGLAPDECIFIGDTIYDAQASSKAGVKMFGVRTGPFPDTADARLREAGVQRTYQDTAEILLQIQKSGFLLK